MNAARFIGAVLAAALVVAGCADDDEPDGGATSPPESPPAESPEPEPDTTTPEFTARPPSTPVPGPVEPTDVEVIVTGLDAPWSIAFVPDGGDDALVSQRDEATVVRVTEDGDVTEVGEVPDVQGEGEGGLHGLAFDPQNPQDLYIYATAGDENRVMRTTYQDDGFGEFETVLDGIPAAARHNGGRLAFGPDGMLYVATGDAAVGSYSQDRDSLAGKILRMTPDGDVPDDNPFDDSLVYSYGHRNIQGLAFDDDDRLWASEFGESTADELNLIEEGGNYGWPEVEGMGGEDRDFIDPVLEWSPAEASPSGLAYFADTLFMASLRGNRLWQIPIPDGEAGDPSSFLEDYGRLRDAVIAPDGTLWVLTNNTDGRGDPDDDDDRILRVTLE